MHEQEHLIILNLVRGLGSIRIRSLMEHFGSAGEIIKQPTSSLERVVGIGPHLARSINRWEELEYREEFRLIKKLNINILTVFDPGYPENLKEIYDPPIVLYIRGNLIPEDKPALAVVGSRRASHYGLQTAQNISHQLAARGFTVVSGMARGIDSRAHRGALAAGGRTIAVLGSGLGNIYPPENVRLAREIAASGAVISEFPLRAVPDRQNFPLRNRVVSGLSMGVLVVEAAQRSGALITARLAMDQGRPVMAIPGRIDSFSARGTNALIRDGAKMVSGIDDILEEFEYLFPRTTPTAPDRPVEGLLKNLSSEEQLVYSLLSEEETGMERILSETGLSSPVISSALISLELKRLIKRLPGKIFIRNLNR
ncbi:MAG: DNA-processing protein DprA [Candidatus Euphemobacter frigidus]|nr:DNA-processing protein DprA [Candidatus Euphemobacter frigidus]MDP8276272.1 DNA-processing protein DprA [Candidatus Euphemobacter frigidus]